MSVEERVIEIVSEQMGVSKDQVTRETSFVNDLGADSLDTVELVMEFEEEFDITIPDEEAEKIQTVGQAIDYIEQQRTPSDRALVPDRTGMKRGSVPVHQPMTVFNNQQDHGTSTPRRHHRHGGGHVAGRHASSRSGRRSAPAGAASGR